MLLNCTKIIYNLKVVQQAQGVIPHAAEGI